MKKFAMLVMMVFLVAGLLAGCSSSKEVKNNQPGTDSNQSTSNKPSNNQAVNSGEKKVIKFWMRGGAATLLSKNFVEDVKAYEAKNPNVKIEYEFIDYADVTTKINTAFAGGTSPDIIETGIIDISNHANLGQFEPLDNYINNWSEKDDTMDVFYELGKFKGKTYGYGYQPFPVIFVWRTDYFQEAGLDPNKPPKDWNELLQYAEVLTKKEGNKVVRGGMDVPSQTGDKLFSLFSWQNGCTLVDEVNDLNYINQPECVEALEYLVNLSQYSIPYDYAKAAMLPFRLGNSAMAYMPPALQDMIAENPDVKSKLGFAPFVPGKKEHTFNGMRLYSISSTSKVKDEAWEFIEFLASKERQEIRMKDTKTPPSLHSLKETFIQLDPAMNQAIMDAVDVGKGNPSVSWAPLFEKYARIAYEQAIFKQKTPADALQEAVKKLKDEGVNTP